MHSVCGGIIETIKHIIVGCHLYKQFRDELMLKVEDILVRMNGSYWYWMTVAKDFLTKCGSKRSRRINDKNYDEHICEISVWMEVLLVWVLLSVSLMCTFISQGPMSVFSLFLNFQTVVTMQASITLLIFIISIKSFDVTSSFCFFFGHLVWSQHQGNLLT